MFRGKELETDILLFWDEINVFSKMLLLVDGRGFVLILKSVLSVSVACFCVFFSLSIEYCLLGIL